MFNTDRIIKFIALNILKQLIIISLCTYLQIFHDILNHMCIFLLACFSFFIFMDVINTDNFKTIPILSG